MSSIAERAAALLARLEPSDEPLLRWVRAHIDDSMLEEIAEADYGMDAETHLAALHRIQYQGEIPSGSDWVKEVLELIRWSEPEDPDWKPGRTGKDGHIMRAFCSAVLLRSAADFSNLDHFMGENQTVFQLMMSSLVLGQEVMEAALKFFCWRMLLLPEDYEERPFFAMAILLLCAKLFQEPADAPFLGRLCDWVIAEEKSIRDQDVHLPAESSQWLLGLTYYNQQHKGWRIAAKTMLLDRADTYAPPAGAAFRDIGMRMVSGSNTT